MNRAKSPNPMHFLLLLILAALGIALVFALLSLIIDRTGGGPLPKWPMTLAQMAGFVWAWQRNGMSTVLKMRERLGLRWLL